MHKYVYNCLFQYFSPYSQRILAYPYKLLILSPK